MEKEVISNFFKNRKVILNSIVGIFIFIFVGMKFIGSNNGWKEIELKEHNFYFSIKIPINSKNVYYTTRTRSGKPMIVSKFENNNKVDIEFLKKQLLDQGWKLKKERIGVRDALKDGDYGFSYQYGRYEYNLVKYNNNTWRESITSE